MKDGHCPMCNSTEVYANQTVRFFSSNSKVYLRDENGEPNPRTGTAFVPYICLNCGYSAMYLQEMVAIKDLTQTTGWEKVTNYQ
jgi:predicted nucleic-acid-binding Zn-ribbon protein